MDYKTTNGCEFCSSEEMEKMAILDDNKEAFKIYCGYFHNHKKQITEDEFAENYRGKFDSIGEFCEDLYSFCDDNYNKLSETLKESIDWNKVWIKFVLNTTTR